VSLNIYFNGRNPKIKLAKTYIATILVLASTATIAQQQQGWETSSNVDQALSNLAGRSQMQAIGSDMARQQEQLERASSANSNYRDSNIQVYKGTSKNEVRSNTTSSIGKTGNGSSGSNPALRSTSSSSSSSPSSKSNSLIPTLLDYGSSSGKGNERSYEHYSDGRTVNHLPDGTTKTFKNGSQIQN
jgi:hypothetical protein